MKLFCEEELTRRDTERDWAWCGWRVSCTTVNRLLIRRIGCPWLGRRCLWGCSLADWWPVIFGSLLLTPPSPHDILVGYRFGWRRRGGSDLLWSCAWCRGSSCVLKRKHALFWHFSLFFLSPTKSGGSMSFADMLLLNIWHKVCQQLIVVFVMQCKDNTCL